MSRLFLSFFRAKAFLTRNDRTRLRLLFDDRCLLLLFLLFHSFSLSRGGKFERRRLSEKEREKEDLDGFFIYLIEISRLFVVVFEGYVYILEKGDLG